MPASSPLIAMRNNLLSTGTSRISSISERITSKASSREARILKRLVHGGDLLPVDLGQVGVDQRGRRRCHGEHPFELGLASLEVLQQVGGALAYPCFPPSIHRVRSSCSFR